MREIFLALLEDDVNVKAVRELVVEIVDAPEKIDAFLPILDEMMAEGMVTVNHVKSVTWRHHAGEKGA
jgi:PII-like signaling protein